MINKHVMTQDQKDMLDILKYFHNFAEKNNVPYTLFFGTLLGSVRHEGYIPWDDDIDVVIRRKDFEIFEDKFLKEDYDKQGYIYQSRRIYPFQALEISRIRNKTISVREEVSKTQEGNIGPWIDIFPYDNVPDDPKLIKEQFDKVTYYNRLIKLFLLVNVGDNDHGLRRVVKTIIQTINERFYKYYFFMPRIFRKRHEWMTKYNDIETNNSGELCYIYHKDYKAYLNSIFPNKKIEDVVLGKFEDEMFYIPREAKEILEKYYGPTYMELPPESERKTHTLTEI